MTTRLDAGQIEKRFPRNFRLCGHTDAARKLAERIEPLRPLQCLCLRNLFGQIVEGTHVPEDLSLAIGDDACVRSDVSIRRPPGTPSSTRTATT